jgi:hypothetical protein
MAPASSLLGSVREFFTLRHAESTVRAYTPAQRSLVAEHADAALHRLVAGRRVAQAVSAAELLRESVARYLDAAALARASDADATAALAHFDRAAALPPLPPDPARPRADPTDDARVRAALSALAASDPLYFDRLSPEDAERARWALDRAATMLRGAVESRSLPHLRGARWGRVAGALLVLAYVAWTAVRIFVLPRNIALDKPVRASSVDRGGTPGGARAPDPKELVDGDLGTSYGVKTAVEDSPNVVIDLLDKYWIQTVAVHNRIDGWAPDDCLPLVLEVSVDGTQWTEVARRTEHFEAKPGWIVNASGRGARYVRLRVDHRGYLALSEVEVYGRK